MRTHNWGPLAVSLAALLACSVDKGGDDGESGTSGGTAGSDSVGTTSAGSGSGDEPTTGSTGEGNAPCVDTPTVLAVDEVSTLGFSAEELLAGKLGPRATTLQFASEPTVLDPAWKGKALPLTVELRHEGGEVRFVDSEPNPDYDDSGNESGFPGECIDRLEVDVTLDFVTQAGELDEQRPGVLRATTVDRADVQVDLLPPALTGSLDPTTLYTDPAWKVSALVVYGTWKGDQAGGSLFNEVRIGEGEDGSVGFGSLAGWGDVIEGP